MHLRLIDFVYHSTIGLRVIKKRKKKDGGERELSEGGGGGGAFDARGHPLNTSPPRNHCIFL